MFSQLQIPALDRIFRPFTSSINGDSGSDLLRRTSTVTESRSHPLRTDSSCRSPGSDIESSASALETGSLTACSNGSNSIRHRGLSPRIPQIPQNSGSCINREDTLLSRRAVDEDLDDRSRRPSGARANEFESMAEGEVHRASDLEAIPLTPRPEGLRRDRASNHTRSDTSHGKPDRSSSFRTPRLPSLKLSRSSESDSGSTARLGPEPRTGDASGTSYAGIFDYFRQPPSESEPCVKGTKTTFSSSLGNSKGVYSTSTRDSRDHDVVRRVSSWIPSVERLKSHIRIPSLRTTLSTSSATSSTRRNSNRTSTKSSLGSSSIWSSSRTCVSMTSSVDSGRTYLFPGVDTTDKFTHRWPVPSSLKKLEGSGRGSSIAEDDSRSIMSSEELGSTTGIGNFDVGMGFERVGRWTTHKWCLFLSVMSVLGYSIAALGYTILTWYQTWDHADVMIVSDSDVLILTTLCSSLLLLAALVGLTGTILNSRPLLAIYALLLWPALISLLSIGYISYKRSTFSLDRKLNMAWSKWYTDAGRAVIQDSLECCGFYDSTHEAVYREGLKGGCYPRTMRPGCKGPLLRFERENLKDVWKAAFSAVPMHFINIVVCLLCANHVTKTFGTGLMPRAYWLKVDDVKRDARNLLERFSGSGGEGYGEGAKRLPPLLARTESGVGVRRVDKVYAHSVGRDMYEDDFAHSKHQRNTKSRRAKYC